MSFKQTLRDIKNMLMPVKSPQQTDRQVFPMIREGNKPWATAPTPTPTPAFPIGQKAYGARSTQTAPELDRFMSDVVFPVTDKYQIPRAVAAGQFAREGRLSGLGANRNNFFNIAAYTNNPGNARSYETPQAGVEAYAKLISGTWKNLDKTVNTRYLPAYDLRSNPEAMMQKIEELGYAPSPYAKNVMNTPEWKQWRNWKKPVPPRYADQIARVKIENAKKKIKNIISPIPEGY